MADNPKNNINLRRKTKPVTVEADATVSVIRFVNKNRTCDVDLASAVAAGSLP